MDKMLNQYFDKVVEGEFNQQRMRSKQWRQNQTMFNSYINLSPAERGRVSVSDMCGFQMQRMDNDSVLLYSFENNAVYHAKIDKRFNKIAVQSVNHEYIDMEKRAVLDNLFRLELVSPYRVILPRVRAGDYPIMNMHYAVGININQK